MPAHRCPLAPFPLPDKPHAMKGEDSWLEWNGARHPVRDAVLIGRGEENDLVLADDKAASRRHALLLRQAGGIWISDLGSRNGSTVNFQRLLHARLLRDGDEILLGSQRMSFRTLLPAIPEARQHNETTQVASQSLAHSGSSAFTCELIVVDADGEILEGDKAARWFFGKKLERRIGSRHPRLPQPVRTWLGRVRASTGPASPPLEISDAGRRLLVTLCRCHEERYFLFVREDSAETTCLRLRTLGLSPREAEVMHWVLEGKTTPEIAAILEITIHTANRHVEHILAKLGVENRQKAIVAVMERLGTP